MSKDILRIATRQSPLAMWQAEYVKAGLERAHPGLQVELLPMLTRGDRILDAPLAKVGGKGLFIKELEHALLDGSADIAVHSMKDVPMEFPLGLELPVVCEREDVRDAFVSGRHTTLDALPEGAVVGSSSLRRQCQLRAARPDIVIRDLRGNVNTRLRKLDEGEYDAIILAAAGLKRLGMEERIRQYLEPEVSLPAVGQGAVGIECRSNDARVLDLIRALEHAPTARRVEAERAMNARLNGGCQVPVAGLAELRMENGREFLHLRGLVGDPAGTTILRASADGDSRDAGEIGIKVAEDLLAQGAAAILSTVSV